MIQNLNDIPMVMPDSVPSVKEELSMLRSLPVDELVNTLVSSLVKFTINLAIAIVVFYVGKFIINKIYTLLSAIFLRQRVDRSLSSFVLSLVKMLLYFILVVTIIGIMGIETSSFIAIFASAGVAIGMALSGTLQNFAGGVLILMLKPYKVGDYIETQGFAGTVREIQIFHTIINTPDNKAIILPNGGLSTGSVNNWSREDYRRVEWIVSISYGDSIDAARDKILEIIHSDSRVVGQYIEDDRRERRLAQVEELKREKDDNLPPKQHGWLWRLLHKQGKKVFNKIDSNNADPDMLQQYIPKVDRSPAVLVAELADSSVQLKARAWTSTQYYWNLYYDINERIYKELPDCGVHFPFPQLDVHMKQA